MLWKKGRRSDNVVDARDSGGGGGMRMGGGKGLSLGAVAIIVVFGLVTGQDPMQILGQIANQAGVSTAPTQTEGHAPPVMMNKPSSCAPYSATPKTPGAPSSSKPVSNIRTLPWCCFAAA